MRRPGGSAAARRPIASTTSTPRRSCARRKPPVRPLDDYAAVLVFGGSMHADQDEHHPWLREETLLLQRLLDQHVPVLGVCLGAQLLARAAHAPVFPAAEPEIGWDE